MSGTSTSLLDEKLGKEKEYWLAKLSPDAGYVAIPPDYKRPPHEGRDAQTFGLALDRETTEDLRRICGSNDSLAFTVFVAALKICLFRYTGAEDVTVGTTIHKSYGEAAALNRLLALRDAVNGELSARQLLQSVKRTLSEAYEHQKYPFHKIIEHLSDSQAPNRTHVFSVAITFDRINDPEHGRDLASDIKLMLLSASGDLRIEIEYDSLLYKRATIEVFAAHYTRILRAITRTPDAKIADIELLSEERRHELVVDFNRTAADYPREKSIQRLFAEQAERTPDAVALEFRGRQLSYGELHRRANKLANHLRGIGVGKGSRVGLFVEHSFEMLIGLWGVLKAGAAYVPLDPEHPPQRLSFILRDAGIEVLLTQERLAKRVPGHDAQLILLDADWATAIEGASVENPPVEVAPADAAYIIYTSGSTGEPKGVPIHHGALVNYVWWAIGVYLRGERLNFALYSSLAFDLTVTSIFVPLLTGNRVSIYSREDSQSPLAEIVKDGDVGVLKLTPSHLALIRERDNSRSSIKRLIVGGEAFETELARRVFDSFGGRVEIFNEYGPTEATVGCMIHLYDPERDDRSAVPVGRPAANARIYILDAQLRPVAENEIGEIYIAGDGLADSYLNRPELTGARFVVDPFTPGGKLYRTGDRARWLPEGIVEYIGRADEQIKFLGHRVELNEIRSAINSHPQVRDSIVVVAKDRNNNPALVAYYVSRQELETTTLRTHLAGLIIEETIPNIFVHLKRLPLTLNGKVNLRALPSIQEVREKQTRAFDVPRTPTEEVLAAMLADVLGVERVGIHDSFFELGGHSLLAAQFISRMRDAFHVEIPLRTLFAAPTIATLAERVETARETGGALQAPSLRPVSRKGSLPLSYAQQQMWLYHQLEPHSPASNTPIALRYSGEVDAAALERSIDEIVRRHEALRTTFSEDESGRPVQIVHPPSPFPLAIVDLTGVDEPEREAEKLAYEEGQQPFDLRRGPVLRVKLLRLAHDEHILLLLMHHIVTDPWSISVFLRELASLYDAFRQGKPSPLPELLIQYADYAAWEQQWLQGETLESHLNYWRERFSGEPAPVELPTDRRPPAAESYKGAIHPFHFTPSLTEGVKALSRREAVTPFMTLLAAFKVLLHSYSRQADLLVTTPIANRNHFEVESLIGFFANTVPLRTDLSGDPTFRAVLRRVRDVALGAYAHQTLPFERLIETLRNERGIPESLFSRAAFGLMTMPMPPPQEQATSLNAPRLLYVDTGVAWIDLTLRLWETQEGMSGNLLYKTDLFDAATIARMADHFQTLLAEVVADSERPIASLPQLMHGVAH